MAKNSDIIKIGFDYKASLEQFLKETNGAFDELDVKAGKQKIFIQFDAKNEKVLEKIKELQKLKLNDFTFEFGESGLSEQLKTFDLLEKKIIEIINLSKGIGSTVGSGSGTGVGNSIVDEKTLNSVIELFGKIESHLSDMKSVFVDVGDGEEFSPLLKVIKEVQIAIDGLRKSVSGISLNMNIDVGSNNQAEAKINEKMSKHLFAYKELFEKLFHSSFDSVITDELFEFEKIIDRYDTTVGKIAAYEKEIDKLVKYSNDRYGKNILKNNDTKGAWSSVSATKSQWTKAKNELNKANDATDTGLSDLFGGNLTTVISQLELVVSKLTEISTAISGLSDSFKNAFKDGVNVSASVEELEKLTSKIKELETELNTLKNSNTTGVSFNNAIDSAKDLNKSINNAFDIPTEKFEEVINMFGIAKEEAKDIVKITEQMRRDKNGKELTSYRIGYSDGSTKTYGESSKPQLIGKNDVLFDSKSINKSQKEFSKIHEEALKINSALSNTSERLNNLSKHPNLITQFDDVENKIQSLNKELINGTISVKEYNKAVNNTIKEYSNLIDIQQKRDLEIFEKNNKQILSEQKVLDEIERKREKSELDSIKRENSSNKKQELAAAKAINKELDEEYKKRLKNVQISEKQLEKDKKKALEFTEKSSKRLSDAISKYSYGDTSDAVSMMKQMNLGISNFGDLSNVDKNIKKLSNTIDKIISDLKLNHNQSLKSLNNEIKLEEKLQSQKDDFNKKNLNAIDLEIQKRKEENELFSKSLKTQMEERYNNISSIENKIKSYQDKLNVFSLKPDGQDRSSKFQSNIDKLTIKINELSKAKDLLFTKDFIEDSDIESINKLKKEIDELIARMSKMSAAEKGSDEASRIKEIDKLTKYLEKNTRISREAKAELKKYLDMLRGNDPSTNVKELHAAWTRVAIAEREAGREGKSFWDIMTDKAFQNRAAQLVSYYLSFTDIIRYGTQAFNTLRELDTALIDLKKTTAMSTSQMEEFYYEANDVAKEMGVTTTAIIEQASAWSRLGYNTKETSTEMAKLSSQFAAISPGMDTETAQEGLVSIMKAFDIDVVDVESKVIDKINVLGNNFAEENQDIVEGLKRSSAAMAAMGQSFEDTAALFTGGMEILQDAEIMGTALRSVAMRIRGYDEETEELSDSLKNVKGEVADLTKTASKPSGITIFADDAQTKYKSMVQYLGEISDIWDELSEKQQTELLEKLFGKTRAQAGAAILKNFDQVRAALEAMEDSADSADKEMEAVQSSIDYKLNELKQTWVGIVQDMANRGDIQKIIDALVDLSEAIGFVADKFGTIGTIGLGAGIFAGFKNASWGNIVKDILNYKNVLEQADASSVKFVNRLIGLHDSAGFAKVDIDNMAKKYKVLDENVINAAKNFQKGTIGLDVFKGSVTTLGASIAKTIPLLKTMALNASVMIAVVLGIKVVTAIFDNFNNTVDEQKEKVDGLKSSYEGLKSEYDTLSQKQDLTEAENRRLEYLERRLELDLRILEAEEKMLLQEKYGNKFTDRFDNDNYNTQYEKERRYLNEEGFIGTSAKYEKESNRLSSIREEIKTEKELQSQYEEGSWAFNNIQKRIDKLTEKETEGLKNLTSQENQLIVNLGRFEGVIESIQSDLNSGLLTGDEKTNAEFLLSEYENMRDTTQSMLDNIQQLNPEIEKTSETIEDIKNQGYNDVEFLSVTKTVSALNNNLKPAIDSISEAYHDIFTEDGFTRENIGLDMFDSIQKELDELSKAGINVDSSSFNNLIEVLKNTESEASDIKDAFDEVAYSIASAALTGVEDFETLKNSLKELGYVDFEMTAFESLLRNKEALKSAGLDLANATELELVAFSRQIVSAENASQAYHMLRYAKELNNLQTMDTSSEVANLKNLAENAGYTGNVITYLTELEKIYQDVATHKFMGERLRIAQSRAEELKTLIEAEASKINIVPKPENQDWEPINKAASSAGKDAAEEYKEALEKELSDLDTVLNFITDTIQDQIDAWNDMKDAAVDALEAERDAAVEALEAQKEATQSQIDAIQDRIDAKQDEIDAIQDARKERQAEIDLQKEQYNLERLQNQNTQLIYKNGQMVYTRDESGIRDARESVDEAKENLHIISIEKEISALENQIEGLEDVIDSLDKQIDSVNNHFDKLIAQTEAYYDNLIKGMEEYKSRWEQIAEIEEQAKINVLLEELGITTDDVMNMSGEAFEQFKQRYLGVLTEMYKGNDDMVASLKEVASGTDFTPLETKIGDAKDVLQKFADTDFTNLKSNVTDVTGTLATNTADVEQNLSGIQTAIAGINVQSVESLDLLFKELAKSLGEISGLLSGTDGVGGIVSSLSNIVTPEAIDGLTNLIGQFGYLKDAVNSVTSAISGGASGTSGAQTAEGGGLATGANGGAATPPAVSGAGGSNLKSALKEQVEEAKTLLPQETALFNGESDSLLSGVNDVIDVLTGGEDASKEGEKVDPSTLVGANQLQYEKAVEIIPQEVTLFNELEMSIAACVSQLQTMISLLEDAASKASSLSVSVSGGTGLNGNANAMGTWGAKTSSKTLTGELGQELVVRGNRFFTVGDNGAEFADIRKGDIVFNHKQTEGLLKNGKITGRGKALAGGTYSPVASIQGIDIKSLQDKFLGKFDNIISPVNSIDKNIESMVRVGNNIHTNNASQDVTISIGDIQLHGVQDVNGLANAISTKLPNMLLQTITKR